MAGCLIFVRAVTPERVIQGVRYGPGHGDAASRDASWRD